MGEALRGKSAPGLRLAPTSIRAASLFVAHHHRHHRPPRGALFALAAELGGQVVGVAIVGRPVARGLQDGRTVEILRLCTDGTRNACSFLMGRARRAAATLGYERVLTYTRLDEGGASPRAAGFEQVALLPARSWAEASRSARPRRPVRAGRARPVGIGGWVALLTRSTTHLRPGIAPVRERYSNQYSEQRSNAAPTPGATAPSERRRST